MILLESLSKLSIYKWECLWIDVLARTLAAFAVATSDFFQRLMVLSCKCTTYSQGGVEVPTGGDSNLWRARERLLHYSRDQQIW